MKQNKDWREFWGDENLLHCEFYNTCPWYDVNSKKCNEGQGYWGKFPSSCWKHELKQTNSKRTKPKRFKLKVAK